ncbi:MAG: hypothetical protein M3Y37_11305 [Chloroflexota bacterium]|nr:hypothetical protein [Chloroflexota bacterium]
MKGIKPSSVAIMYAAQRVVDEWVSSVRQRPFADTVHEAGLRLWSGDASASPVRRAFEIAANRIRNGRGHAVTDPGPLLDHIEASLMRSDLDVVSDKSASAPSQREHAASPAREHVHAR